MRSRASNLLAGAASGLIATVPQTAAMLLVRQAFRSPGRFPPRQVAEEVLEFFTHGHRRPTLNEPAWWAITAVSHFGFGTAAGAVYGLMPSRAFPGPLRGTCFGLLVWAFSYGVALPMLGIVTPQADQPMKKNAQLVAAHLAWGAAVGVLFRVLAGHARGVSSS